MITEIYVIHESFRYIDALPDEKIGSRIECMAIDWTTIKDNSDQIFKNDQIYYVELFKGRSISDELYGDKTSRRLSRDQQVSLRKIIEYSRSTELTTANIIGMLPYHDIDTIRGLFYFHYEDTEDIYSIHSEKSWLRFHRHFIGVYPISEVEFLRSCIKYFGNIYIHPEVENTLSTLEPNFKAVSIQIIRHLSALNDEFPKYHIPNNRPKSLKDFASATGCEASPEGNAARKKDFTFAFNRVVDDKIVPENVCCESHLKLSKSDNPGDTHYYFNRIYFHEGKEHLCDGKILIGHIGKHL